MTGDFAPGERWSLEFRPCDVIVLFDWPMTVDLSTIPAGQKAYKQALADLLTVLETQAPVTGLTRAQVEQARNEVSKDMDW